MKLRDGYEEEVIRIVPFEKENQNEVKNLILAGLGEHWGVLDRSLNPDLNDIAACYARATFLVAWANNRIVGSGGLVQHTDGTAEIVRMSVAVEMRRQGVGRQILQRLIAQARGAGFERIILETTETWSEVIEFYKRNGFQITHYHDGDVYFVLELRN